MKSVPKLIARFIRILLISVILLILLNLFVIYFISVDQSPNRKPYNQAEEIASSLVQINDEFTLDSESLTFLEENNVWAILIEEETHSVVWQTENLPDSIPVTYSLNDISDLTTGYIDGYPTYTGNAEDGLLVLGYPKDSYWKHVSPSWDFQFIANFPQIILIILLSNVFLIFLIYLGVTSKLVKSVNPIVQGIRNLSEKKEINIEEKGPLSELAMNLNQTSQTLHLQEEDLKKRENARANWIAGVSHDIRTPLSMVMGYAGQLKDSSNLSTKERKKATIILRQSEKMRNLINDLNLASKLEYNMQPLNMKKINVLALVRQVVVTFLNNDIDNNHPIVFNVEDDTGPYYMQADEDLVKRALINLIQNAINHNEDGCTIYIFFTNASKNIRIVIEDDGVGVSDKVIDRLNNTSHYMISDDSTTEQRHGLGLLLVKQIVESHKGEMRIDKGQYGGFSVTLEFPINYWEVQVNNNNYYD